MADEEDKENEGGEAKPPRNSKKMILIGLGVLVLLGGGAAFFLLHGHGKKGEVPMTPKEMERLIKNNPIVDLKPFVVNLNTGQSGDNPKYLKVRVAFKLNNPSVAKEIDYRMPEIQNIVLILLGSETPDELGTTGGKLALRNQIRHRVNSVLTLGRVTSVYFTEFVIQ